MASHKTIVTILVSITGIVHLLLGIVSILDDFSFLNLSLVLNGIGYFVLLAALYYLPMFEGNEDMLRLFLILFTAATFISYFAVFLPDDVMGTLTNPVGMFIKLVEVVIIVKEFQYRSSSTEMAA